MVAGHRFELWFTASKAGVLPLDDPAETNNYTIQDILIEIFVYSY